MGYFAGERQVNEHQAARTFASLGNYYSSSEKLRQVYCVFHSFPKNSMNGLRLLSGLFFDIKDLKDCLCCHIFNIFVLNFVK